LSSTESKGPSIVWFRLDLRLDDNPALVQAAKNPAGIIPLIVYNPEDEGAWPAGAASKWWLHQSLLELEGSLAEKGLRLSLIKGPALDSLIDVVRESGAREVCWNRRYEPAHLALDQKLEAQLSQLEATASVFDGNVLRHPASLLNKQGKPYQVYTPFSKNYLADLEPLTCRSTPRALKPASFKAKTLGIKELELLPKVGWYHQLARHWQPGAEGAKKQLAAFVNKRVANYRQGRDIPGQVSTSRLSPHLHFGEISPRRVWNALVQQLEVSSDAAFMVLRQLIWREFGHSILYHFPTTQNHPLRESFEKFPWKRNKRFLLAWQKGQTGYPIVDAGMQELWQTGWMHNRVRMIVASFLVKDLLIPWQDGASWFWDTLVDADLANNTLGWQWTAGCGPDAAPYFRVFNPILQGEKFDADGVYVRRWLPVLNSLDNKWIHKPWEAPRAVLDQAGIVLGHDYPLPIVDHAEARDVALEAYEQISQKK
jgi:deoxyribodipyrimidine photo-lyase